MHFLADVSRPVRLQRHTTARGTDETPCTKERELGRDAWRENGRKEKPTLEDTGPLINIEANSITAAASVYVIIILNVQGRKRAPRIALFRSYCWDRGLASPVSETVHMKTESLVYTSV